IHDWIRGPASADGASYEVPTAAGKQPRPVSFRVAERLKHAKGKQSNFGRDAQALDTDLVLFEQRYPTLDAQAKRELLVHAMAPGLHWTPTGLLATRLFLSQR
ncbi:MAG: iron-containing redox enzyme family protein, partial [Comamonadaceae bacterium]|nr:iron-containing redox enzyme family protein [Comamonadaceae bacterium]